MLRLQPNQALVERVAERIPLVRSLYRWEYERRFARVVPWARRFRGVYATFAEAAAAAPSSKPVGYDNPQAASFMAPSAPVSLGDYPVLFWLQRAMAECPSLLDIGGYVGISYYSFRSYLGYPDNLKWLVYDVPAVAEAGRRIAEREQSRGLSFLTSLGPNHGAHAVLAAGSLQFIEPTFAELLSGLAELPTHLIVNKTPLTDRPSFVTLQDLGPSVCPYRIFNRDAFLQPLLDLGYELRDEWRNAEFGCHIPFHPERSVPNYSGLYFRLSRQIQTK